MTEDAAKLQLVGNVILDTTFAIASLGAARAVEASIVAQSARMPEVQLHRAIRRARL